MIGYTMVGTTDLKRAERFYDPLMTLIGQERCYCDEQVSSWGRKDDDKAPRFFACYPFDTRPASVGNGAMTAFLVESANLIDRLFETAMERGGSERETRASARNTETASTQPMCATRTATSLPSSATTPVRRKMPPSRSFAGPP